MATPAPPRPSPTAPPAPPTPTAAGRLAPPGYASPLAGSGFDLSAGSARLRARFRLDEPGRVLAVPLRSQLDGTVYAEANCGPASLAMVLEAYGLRPTVPELRALANRLQGTTAPDTGVWPEVLARIAAAYGFQVTGPRPSWTPDEVRAALDRHEPVITIVKYRELPSNGASIATTDHYIVLTGYQGDRFFYNDPAFADEAGFGRVLTESELRRAWAGAAAPGIALAIGPGPGVPVIPDLLAAGIPVPPEPVPATAVPEPVPAAVPGAPSDPTPLPTVLVAGATPADRAPEPAPPWYAFLAPAPAGLAYGAAVVWFGRKLSRRGR